MEHELDHALRPLREGLGGVERVEAREVDEREREQEPERDDRGARQPRVSPLEPVPAEDDEEDRGEDVGERQRAGELPLQLVERDGEHGGQEEAVEHGLREDALARCHTGGGGGVSDSSLRLRVTCQSSTSTRASKPGGAHLLGEASPCSSESMES